MKAKLDQLRARLAILAYSCAGFCLRPITSPYLAVRALRGKEDRTRLKERYGYPTRPRPEGPLIWLHAASVGETMAIIPLIEHILRLGIRVLITTGTTTSAALVQNRLANRVVHQYMPLDYKMAIRRFLDYWRPNLALTCESEVWPMRSVELDRCKIPQIWVNAHLSDNSFKAWKKRPALAHYLFSKIDIAIGQTEIDAQKFRDLGVRSVAISGNLKADNPPLVDPEVLDHYKKAIGNRPIWAAISTHEGEELIAANVHMALKSRLPNLMTIIVPRHPERTHAILEKLKQKNLKIVCKSSGTMPDETTDILIGDTIGEMGLFLRLARVAFIGKSLTEKGGHNPLEPALLGTAIVSGPYIENFRTTYEKLVSAKGALIINDQTQLAVQVNQLLTKHDLQRAMANAAYDTATRLSGALERTLHVLYPFLQPLTVEARLAQEWNMNNEL